MKFSLNLNFLIIIDLSFLFFPSLSSNSSHHLISSQFAPTHSLSFHSYCRHRFILFYIHPVLLLASAGKKGENTSVYLNDSVCSGVVVVCMDEWMLVYEDGDQLILWTRDLSFTGNEFSLVVISSIKIHPYLVKFLSSSSFWLNTVPTRILILREFQRV